MTRPIDAPSSQAHDHKSLLSTTVSEVADFGEAVFHSGMENPINGAMQLVNHVSGAHLPEMHLVDSDQVSQSIGGKLGTIVGSAADVYGMTMVTGGLGGAGYLVSAARMGAVGATYAGIFQPSDPNSKNFYTDRLSGAAVSGATFAGMGAGAAALDALGVFAAPAARSFMGSTAYGALSGAAGGAVYSEANAIIKQDRLLPKFTDFISDVGSYSAFGAAFGGIGYGVNRLMNPKPELVSADNNEVTVANGKTISIQDEGDGQTARVNSKPRTSVPQVPRETSVTDAQPAEATEATRGGAGSGNDQVLDGKQNGADVKFVPGKGGIPKDAVITPEGNVQWNLYEDEYGQHSDGGKVVGSIIRTPEAAEIKLGPHGKVMSFSTGAVGEDYMLLSRQGDSIIFDLSSHTIPPAEGDSVGGFTASYAPGSTEWTINNGTVSVGDGARAGVTYKFPGVIRVIPPGSDNPSSVLEVAPHGEPPVSLTIDKNIHELDFKPVYDTMIKASEPGPLSLPRSLATEANAELTVAGSGGQNQLATIRLDDEGKAFIMSNGAGKIAVNNRLVDAHTEAPIAAADDVRIMQWNGTDRYDSYRVAKVPLTASQGALTVSGHSVGAGSTLDVGLGEDLPAIRNLNNYNDAANKWEELDDAVSRTTGRSNPNPHPSRSEYGVQPDPKTVSYNQTVDQWEDQMNGAFKEGGSKQPVPYPKRPGAETIWAQTGTTPQDEAFDYIDRPVTSWYNLGKAWYDGLSRLTQVKGNVGSFGQNLSAVNINYADNISAEPSGYELRSPNQEISLQPLKNNTGYSVHFENRNGDLMDMGNDYTWTGKINIEPRVPGGKPDSVVFRPSQGEPFSFRPNEDVDGVSRQIIAGVEQPGAFTEAFEAPFAKYLPKPSTRYGAPTEINTPKFTARAYTDPDGDVNRVEIAKMSGDRRAILITGSRSGNWLTRLFGSGGDSSLKNPLDFRVRAADDYWDPLLGYPTQRTLPDFNSAEVDQAGNITLLSRDPSDPSGTTLKSHISPMYHRPVKYEFSPTAGFHETKA